MGPGHMNPEPPSYPQHRCDDDCVAAPCCGTCDLRVFENTDGRAECGDCGATWSCDEEDDDVGAQG